MAQRKLHTIQQHSRGKLSRWDNKQVIFRTTEPGFPTEDAMNALFDWYNSDKETYPLVKSALFSYEFVSIHPFQDGNGHLAGCLQPFWFCKMDTNGFSMSAWNTK